MLRKRAQVKVYDFAVPRPDTPNFFETFHAKVISADEEWVYVGSANLSRHSKETSMELGMLVSGSAAAHGQFIAGRIVTELRTAKQKRQFIFSTHNANIPVFEDSE